MKTCVLCGHEARDVSVGLVAWQKPVGRERFSAVPRCIQLDACRKRVEANGDAWEVRENEPRSVRDLIREIAR